MYAPLRKHSDSMFQSDWAEAWLSRRDGWEVKAYEVAGFDPIRFREICASCTLTEIVRAWKTQKALSDYAWNDKDAT